MNNNLWDEAKIQDFINNDVEESLMLDYKRAASLSKDKKNEITKDVSAMANSAGGVIIYGVAEYSDPSKKHLPENIDPVDRTNISKEWIEHVLGNIQPKIPNLLIHPIQLSSGTNDCVYVVEVPKGTTAHQASTKKFYKRYNFESVAMDHHEILDVMSRKSLPKIELNFEMEFKTRIYEGIRFGYQSTGKEVSKTSTLIVRAINQGNVYAKYVNLIVGIPSVLIEEHLRDSEEFTSWVKQNTKRDVIGSESTGGYVRHNYGPQWYSPILPGRNHTWEIELLKETEKILSSDMVINWEVFADNSSSVKGSIPITDIIKSYPEIDDYTKKSKK